jgi:hypothetical protein
MIFAPFLRSSRVIRAVGVWKDNQNVQNDEENSEHGDQMLRCPQNETAKKRVLRRGTDVI